MAEARTYLDHNATAPLEPAAKAAMLAALEAGGNASSVHGAGRAARAAVEAARRQVAALVGAAAQNVVFTSGASEAASTLLTPDWTVGRGALVAAHLYVAAADHPCLLGGGRFAPERVTRIGVDSHGVVDLAALEAALARHDRAAGVPLVAMHAANNETGVIQPMAEIGRLAKAVGGLTVFDAVQAAGRIPLDISEGYADFLILSSHKIGGPMGAGAIVAASDLTRPRPLVAGGGQERGQRGGTENVPAIAGFGAAAERAAAGLAEMPRVAALRDRFEAAVAALAPDAVFYGRAAPRLANTSFFAIPGLKAETAQIAFDLAGVALSAGSACSSGKVGPSHVLAAMGEGDQAGALRVSLGRASGEDDLAAFRAALDGIVARRRRRAAAA